MDVGVIGASGYGGTELLRLLAQHPTLWVRVVGAESNAGNEVGSLTPSLSSSYPNVTFTESTPEAFGGLDVCFLALPHGASQHLVPSLLGNVGLVVDLAADFRFQTPEVYDTWYGEAHAHPELLSRFVYGLPELDRSQLAGATAIAVPGCYPTAATIALHPFVESGFVKQDGIIVDAASGLSGAGRRPSDRLHFAHAHDDLTAYGWLDHRHTPEIERNLLGAEVLFTPPLAPISRGMLATCYAKPNSATSTTADAMALLHEAYSDEPFVVVTNDLPSTKATLGSNSVHVTARVDPRTGWLIAISALDNLGKGAAGAAIQAANAAVGLPETLGLPMAGLYP
ncbi:MAG: N-acetyl-gamma-glutamyl-phosphate reductase [Actinomycetota bacterium]